MYKKDFLVFMAFLAFVISGCASLNTELGTSIRQVPAQFDSSSKNTENFANVNWRGFFKDSLLVNLIDTALVNNPDLMIALQRIEAAQAGVTMAKGMLLPRAELSPSLAIRKYGLYTMDGAGNISTEITPGQIVPIDLPDIYLGLNASWEADIWGKLKNKKKAAFADYLASIEGKNFVVSNLVANIAIGYFELVALDNQLAFLEQAIAKQEEALEVIQLKKEAGRANELAVQQFQAQVLNSQAMAFEVNQQIVEIENYINFLLGRYPQPIERDAEALFKELPQQIFAGVPSQLLVNRPDIREAELLLEASKFDLQSAKAAFYPRLLITGGIGLQSFDPQFLFLTPASLAYSAVGGLIAPLINLNDLKAQFNTAKASQLQAVYQYQKTIFNAFMEVSNELSNIENLSKIRSLKEQQNDVLTQSIEISSSLYVAGRATYLEVLLAQQNSLYAQLELIEASKRQQISMVSFYKELGGGWR